MNLNLTLIGQMVTFLLLWWIVYTYIWPIFTRSLSERQSKIVQGLNMADHAEHKLQEADKRAQRMIAEAKDQAADILAQAQKQADLLVNQAREEGRRVGNKEIELARGEIQQEQNKARDALRQELAELIVKGTKKVLSRELNQSDHERFVKDLTEQL